MFYIVLKNALMSGGCLESVSVKLAWLALEWKINTVMLASLLFALRCLSCAMPSRRGRWHGPLMRFGGRLMGAGLLLYHPCTRAVWGAAEQCGLAGCLGYLWVLEDPGWALPSVAGLERGAWALLSGVDASASLLDVGSRGSCCSDPAASQGLPDPLGCPIALCPLWLQLSSSQSLSQLEAAEGKAGPERQDMALAEELLASALLLLAINSLHEIKVSLRPKTP